MPSVSIREDFRRDGLCMTFLTDESIMSDLARSFPGAILNIGYPSICTKEREICERITDALSNIEVETATVGHAIPEHILTMAEIANRQKNTSANFWIPLSDYMISQTLKKPIEEILQQTRSMITLWKDHSDRPIDVALTDCTLKEHGLRQRLGTVYGSLKEYGARSIIVCDTRGCTTPKKLTDLLVQFRDINAEIEYHPHNDNGLALENVDAAINLGAKRIGTAVFGFGERGTMLDPREIVSKYNIRYNPENFSSFKKKFKFLVESLDENEEIFSQGTIITGTQYRLHGRDPEIKTRFGVTSDRNILGRLIGVDPFTITSQILGRIKDDLYIERRRSFSPKELKAKYEEYKRLS